MKVYSASQQLSSSEIVISEENVLRILGLPNDQADEYLIDLIHEIKLHCSEIASPVYSCCITDQKPILRADKMIIEGETFEINRTVASSMKNSESVVVFIGTCGEQVEQYSKKLMKEGNSLEGYIADIIGSEITEGIAEYMQMKILNDMAGAGLNITNRYSPGYCKWPVNDQQKLFRLMGHNTSGVMLTESSLMIPIKSVSGIIGIGKNVKFSGYTCARCEMDQCLYRGKVTGSRD